MDERASGTNCKESYNTTITDMNTNTNNNNNNNFMKKFPNYSSKAMLLRLFQSELFTASQAVHYLQKYSTEPGIQFYLCERLKRMPFEDVEILLLQLCHLMIMSKFESGPIEALLLDLVKKSVHISIQMLWMMEIYMNDFKNNPNIKNPISYLRAARMLLQVQRVAFKHEISETSFQHSQNVLMRASDHLENFYGPKAAAVLVNSNKYQRVGPPIAGFGLMLTALAFPQLVKAMQPLVLIQSRKADPFDKFHSTYSSSHKMHIGPFSPEISKSFNNSFSSLAESHVTGSTGPGTTTSPITIPNNSDSSGPSLEELSKGKAFSLKRYISKTAKNLLNHAKHPMQNIQPDHLPSVLFPTIPFYYHGEMQFINSLTAVSDRLVSLNSKGNRLKALHAELCLINHNLPAPICVHAWCQNHTSSCHHKILSILPYESSVLNSAERVPYIIFIEILNGSTDEEFSQIVSDKNRENGCDYSEKGDDRLVELFSSSPSSSPEPSSNLNLNLNAMNGGQSEDRRIATASGMIDISERMRTAAVMLAQLARQSLLPNSDLVSINTIRNRIINEMETLEKDRLIDVLQGGNRNTSGVFDEKSAVIEPEIIHTTQTPSLHLRRNNDPSALIFQEDWEGRKGRIAKISQYSHLPGWDILSVIVKSSTDMRQEFLAYQLVREYKKIFSDSGLPIFLHPCKVLITANGGGLIETIPNSISIHSIKKTILLSLSEAGFKEEDLSLKKYFIKQFGEENCESYCEAVDNFIFSLVGYSLLQYTLQVRDRHNGNILLDHRRGHLIHIDFGFMLSNSPGYVGFESAPFKLTADYLDLLDGIGSERWHKFRILLTRGFLALRKHSDQLFTLLEGIQKNSTLPCFYGGEAALIQFRERLHVSLTDNQIDSLIGRLMTTSALNVFTRLYDNYQYYTNGIL